MVSEMAGQMVMPMGLAAVPSPSGWFWCCGDCMPLTRGAVSVTWQPPDQTVGKCGLCGRVYEFEMVLYPIGNLFARGHRIRLDVSSSNFPRFDLNPNTGEPLGLNRRWRTAENTIYHDAAHPSHLLLPVIPG